MDAVLPMEEAFAAEAERIGPDAAARGDAYREAALEQGSAGP